MQMEQSRAIHVTSTNDPNSTPAKLTTTIQDGFSDTVHVLSTQINTDIQTWGKYVIYGLFAGAVGYVYVKFGRKKKGKR